MEGSEQPKRGHRARTWGLWAIGTLALVVLLITSVHAEILQSAIGINPADKVNAPTNSNLAGAIAGAKALVSPAQLFMLAAAPLGILAGGAMTMFGHRKGMMYVYASIGGLLLVSVANGIIA